MWCACGGTHVCGGLAAPPPEVSTAWGRTKPSLSLAPPMEEPGRGPLAPGWFWSCPEATFQGSRAEFLGWKEGLSMSPVPSHSPSSGPRTGNPALGGGPGVTAQVCTCGVLLGRKRLPPSPPRPPGSSPPQSPGHGDGPCRLPPALTESLGLLHYFNLVFGFFLF